jgi:HlyD family secretion protein
MKRIRKKVGPITMVLLVLAGLVYAFMPRAVPVELASVTRGPIEVAVLEDGRTRIKERYVIAAPLSGRLTRVLLKPGDRVEAGGTLITSIEPADPDLLDPRTLAQAEARLRVAQSAREHALPMLERARVAHELAVKELERARSLHQSQTLPREALDRAEHNERIAAEELKAGQFALDVAGYEVELARAALYFTRPGAARDADSARFDIRSPIDGRVLRVFQESATVVAPGTPLIELGDPSDLEVEIDVLSPDAVRIRPGARVQLEHWGGDRPLEGRVRRTEPAGFTKISALGVEEQRVWVIVDLIEPPAEWQLLGDAYRVEARIVIQESERALKIPVGALFRRGDNWATFAVADGRAQIRKVAPGLRNDREAEILEGLEEGDRVVLHPSDRIADGTAVAPR